MVRLMELVTDPKTGRMSEAKLWLHPAKALMLWALWHETQAGRLTPEMLIWFALVLFAHEAISRFVSWRFGNNSAQAGGAPDAAR